MTEMKCNSESNRKRASLGLIWWFLASLFISLCAGAAFAQTNAEELVSMPAQLSAFEEHTADEVDAYERLLGDAMHGDAMLFVREDAVEAAWAIVDPILANATTLHPYEPGSWGPREADRLAVEVDGWHNLEERKKSTVDVPNPG